MHHNETFVESWKPQQMNFSEKYLRVSAYNKSSGPAASLLSDG